MGFVGAPLASAISFDLIALFSLIAAVVLHIRDSRYNSRIVSERIRERLNNVPATSTHPPQSIHHLQSNGNAAEHEQSEELNEKNGLKKIAWHPIDHKCFTDFKVLVRLGVSGVGQLAAVWWCWELVGREFLSFLHLHFAMSLKTYLESGC
jgi:hypothetical protein